MEFVFKILEHFAPKTIRGCIIMDFLVSTGCAWLLYYSRWDYRSVFFWVGIGLGVLAIGCIIEIFIIRKKFNEP